MIDYSVVAVVGVGYALISALVVYRARQNIPAGQEGITLLGGRYRRTLVSGVSWISPVEMVRRFPAGTSARFGLGKQGVLVRGVPPGKAAGLVRIGAIEVPAYAWRRDSRDGIEKGTSVQVIYLWLPGGGLPDGAVVEPVGRLHL